MQALVIGSAAASLGSGILQGAGMSAGYKEKEQQAQRLAFASRTAADQTDAQFRDELHTTLGNIQAIRAAAGVGGDSATTQAVQDRARKVSDTQRRIQVGNLTSQADQAASDAEYYSSAASTALGLGVLGGVTNSLGRLGGIGAPS